MKTYKNGWGIGGVFGWIQQYSADKGGLADRLDGFKGRSLGVGPNVGYSTKIGRDKKTQFSFTARVIYEFEAKNRPKGWPVLFGGSFIF